MSVEDCVFFSTICAKISQSEEYIQDISDHYTTTVFNRGGVGDPNIIVYVLP